jgi:hypothetical protein
MNKVILIIFLISSQIVLAQSTLPKCQGSDYKKYNNCFGEAVEQNGNYIGEFKNGKYHGQGTHTSKKNNKFVGEFREGKKVLGTYTFNNGDKILINNYKYGSYYGKANTHFEETKYVGEIVLKEKNDDIEIIAHGQGTHTFFKGPNKGKKYVGNYKDGVEHGQGTHTFKNGDKYVGNYKNGVAHGQGTYTWGSGPNKGDKYVGNYKDGVEHGQGTYTFKNGNKYVGNYKNGVEHGQGTYTWGSGPNKGDKYVGNYKNGVVHGQGTYTFKNGRKYVGKFKENRPDGHGILINEKTGYFYTGNFKNGKYEGVGTEILKDGSRYTGEFKNDEYEGKGVYLYSNGDKYIGQFKKGIIDGQGVKTFKDGRKYFGEFKDGQYEGLGTYIYSDRRKYVGEFKKGRFHSSGVLYDKDGKILKELKNDIFNFSFLSQDLINYSILIEEDFNSAMFIYRHQNSNIIGTIFDYENYEFFSKTYINKYNETISYVQPAYLKILNDQKSYQREEYRLKKFEYNYTSETLGSSLLTFKVPDEMNKYINESIPFSISTLSQTAWYGGTFTLIQNDYDLKKILNNNPDTFCKIILHTKKLNVNIKEFKKSELSLLEKNC